MESAIIIEGRYDEENSSGEQDIVKKGASEESMDAELLADLIKLKKIVDSFTEEEKKIERVQRFIARVQPLLNLLIL